MEIKTCGKPIDSLLEKVLCMNILSSDYFKELYRLKTYHEVVDEIYNQVDHVEPWMTGNCRGPSTAFCLLYKFFTMKLTVKQMHGLLKHEDSPYIRAVGRILLTFNYHIIFNIKLMSYIVLLVPFMLCYHYFLFIFLLWILYCLIIFCKYIIDIDTESLQCIYFKTTNIECTFASFTVIWEKISILYVVRVIMYKLD